VSRFKLEIDVSNKGVAECEIVRHLAPITCGSIMKRLPLQDRVHRFAENFVYIETGLVIGAEKQKSQFRRGEIAYLTVNGSICVFVKDSSVQLMNPIGSVTSNIEIIESSQPGDVMEFRKKPTA
jgi:hypothetical protein